MEFLKSILDSILKNVSPKLIFTITRYILAILLGAYLMSYYVQYSEVIRINKHMDDYRNLGINLNQTACTEKEIDKFNQANILLRQIEVDAEKIKNNKPYVEFIESQIPIVLYTDKCNSVNKK